MNDSEMSERGAGEAKPFGALMSRIGIAKILKMRQLPLAIAVIQRMWVEYLVFGKNEVGNTG